MAGLDPAIQARLSPNGDEGRLGLHGRVKPAMTNRPNGTLYVGVTSELVRRAWEHGEGIAQGFTKRHGLKRLVYAEWHDSITGAIQREKNLKHWPRAWKVSLIRRDNPRWDDLYDGLR